MSTLAMMSSIDESIMIKNSLSLVYSVDKITNAANVEPLQNSLKKIFDVERLKSINVHA